MKKVLLFFALFMGLLGTSWAYDFYAVSPSGHTLNYNIIEGGVEVAAGNDGITGSLTIPSSVVNNGVTYSVIAIGDLAFTSSYVDNNSGLTSVTIPNSVTSIGYGAFAYCSGLTSVTIPNSVTSIGYSAFAYCSGLTSVTIPNSVTSIGQAAFYRCSGLTSVNYTGTIAQWSNLTFSNGASNPTYYSHSLNINGSPVTNLVIPDSVTSIGDYAFVFCSGLTSVTIHNSVTSIGDSAFAYCSGMADITFEGQFPPAINDGAFSGVPSNVAVTIPCGTLALYAARLPNLTIFVENAFTFTAQSEDESKGIVQVLNEPTCTNPNAVLNAVPASGYRFDHWSTGSTQNPYSLIVTTDTVITAYFVSEGGTEGIGEVGSQQSEGRVYAVEGKIVVDGAEGETVRVYDVTGRMVQTFTHSSNQALPAGVYMVEVGQHPARKVVVLR